MSNSNMFSGKVVLITGASSGIGAATAIHFASEGASLALTGRNTQNLEEIARKCEENKGVKTITIVADLNVEDDIKNIVERTINTFGKLDILVNNAGIFKIGTLEETSVQDYDAVFSTNIRSVYILTKLVVPYLEKTKGNIVNVSSLAGTRPLPGLIVYCMAKAALNQFTKCLAVELAAKQIRVNSVNPGTIDTDIFRRAGMNDEENKQYLARGKAIHPLGRVGQPEEVAMSIAFLASSQASFTTGETLAVDGGRNIVCPR
ncbi:hypothetical protein MML48_2g00001817 [Holotrichia oblita]|uniref:Uncharacterized protein n=1 Tax=Holotrichia oblita TaxID=644536 RepID=A0ACB9TP58_HOLOL|nr:hypothetical protein MML48_2g00001817 [Holotrichia oblita]